MPALFDFLYREYCRARLVEMRRQLLLSRTNGPESTEADGNISSDGANDRGSNVGDQREDDQAGPG